MLTVLGGLAEFERELIRARTSEGRKRAQHRSVRFGRPRKLTPHQRQEALARLQAGETQADIARPLRVRLAHPGGCRRSRSIRMIFGLATVALRTSMGSRRRSAPGI